MRKLLVDFEGYQINQKFFFKEVTIYDFKKSVFNNYFIKTPIIKNNKTINFLIKYLHKIPMEYGSIDYRKIIKILNKPSIIYCKGKSKVDIIQQYTNNTIVDLELIGCPKYKFTHTHQLNCELSNHCYTNHCALNKTYYYLRWLKAYETLKNNKIC